MILRKACRFEIRSKGEQICKIEQFCGCSPLLFNWVLAWQTEQYEQDNNYKFSHTRLANLLLRSKTEWFKDGNSLVLDSR